MTNLTEPDDINALEGALEQVISALKRFQPEDRKRILETVLMFFQIDPLKPQPRPGSGSVAISRPDRLVGFSEDTTMGPKEFLLEKQPRTDVERIACLAYYLTHYHDTPHFKTLDLSKLNTESAQPKFANAAYAANNALKRGYLAPATKGQRQLSAVGEQFVQVLPDRDAAKAAMTTGRPRKSVRRKKKQVTSGKATRI